MNRNKMHFLGSQLAFCNVCHHIIYNRTRQGYVFSHLKPAGLFLSAQSTSKKTKQVVSQLRVQIDRKLTAGGDKMNCEQCVDLHGWLSAIGTLLAVVVALALAIVPAMCRASRDRRNGAKRILLSLKIIAKAIKDYRHWNPNKFVLYGGIIHYSYAPQGLNVDINFDLNREIDEVMALCSTQDSSIQDALLTTMRSLKEIVSGFPKIESDWDNLEALLVQAQSAIKKRGFQKQKLGLKENS